jgi:hypothetical protein
MRSYSAPIGEKRLVKEVENVEPEYRRAGVVNGDEQPGTRGVGKFRHPCAV